LQLPSPRGKYAYHREELARLLRANPGLVQRDIAKHFGVSQSTANDWLKKIKAGV
jgi:transposase